MRRCIYCGKEYDDETTFCAIDHEPTAQVPPPSERAAEPAGTRVEFIRLFFKSPVEEEFAVRCAQLIARFAGQRISLLRPDTTWSEILSWFGPRLPDSATFAFILKQELGPEFNEVLANYDFMTFREFVEYVCGREHSAT